MLDVAQNMFVQKIFARKKFLISPYIAGIRTPNLFYIDQEKNAIYMEYLDDCITLKQHIDDLLKNDNQPQISMVAEEIGKAVAQLHENSIIHGDLTTSNFLVRLSASGQMSDLLLIDFGLTTVESAHNPEDKGKQTFSVYPQDTHKGIWGLFQSEKSLSLIDRKRLYIINLTFFVWWHECHRFLLKF